MPKQSGIYQIKGKFENRSYYKPKNMSTGLFRSINQQMSERVKTEPNFANTRANAAEFGCATSWANQTTSVLGSFAPVSFLGKKRADIFQYGLNVIKLDGTHPFGQRSFNVNGWQDIMMAKLNAMPRVSFDENYGGVFRFYSAPFSSTSATPYRVVSSIGEIPGLSQHLADWGATSVVFDIYVCRWECGYYSSLLGSYYPTQLITRKIASISSNDIPVSQSNTIDLTLDGTYPSRWMVKTLVVATPYKRVGGQSYPLQHLRSFKLFDLPYGETRIASVVYKGTTYLPGSQAFTLDVANYPDIDVNMALGAGSTLGNPQAKVNGSSCSCTKISNTLLRIRMVASLDARPLLTIVIVDGDHTYRFETN